MQPHHKETDKRPSSQPSSSSFSQVFDSEDTIRYESPPQASSELTHVVRSCQSKIGQDFIDESSQLEVQPRATRSYQSDSEDDNDGSEKEQITNQQKKIRKDQLVKGYTFAEDCMKKINNKQKNVEEGLRADKEFAEEILQSEEISVMGSHSSHNWEQKENNLQEKNQPKKEKKENKEKKVQYFNIMLVGGQSTGKTTYMECMTRKYKTQKMLEKSDVIKKHTQEFQETIASPNISDLSLDFRIIDTPGFSHSTIRDYVNSIKGEIRRRAEKYQQEKSKAMTESAIYTQKERQFVDPRIHCCLFFFRGPRIHQDDWILQRQLHSICNLIPIIAKGDSYSIRQIEELKKSIRRRCEEETIRWFDVEEYMRQKDGNIQILKGPYGLSPPFMIACSTSQIEDKRQLVIARQFRWGNCLIENPHHTEFHQLRTLVLQHLRPGLVLMTELKCKRFAENLKAQAMDAQIEEARIQKQLRQQKMKRFTIGFFKTVLFVGGTFAVFNNRLKILNAFTSKQ